jgi:predicted DNA-binding transcriptional regulator YafY
MKRLASLSAAAGEAAARHAVADPGKKDWTRLNMPIESIEHAAYQLLGIGAEIEVLAPAALRDRIQELIRATAARYAACVV